MSLPRRVLLALGGHLGDVVIGSALIPRIRATLPTAEIGVLVGSWARPVLDGHPDVRWLHFYDHWKLNRADRGLAARARRHLVTRGKALAEIEAVV